MSILNSITQYWSKYELNMEILLLSSIFTVLLATIYLSTKSKRLLLLSGLSFLVAGLFNIIGILALSIFFTSNITEIFRLIPIITFILLASNLGILVGFYIYKSHGKKFSIKSVIQEYYSDSIKQTVFLLLLGISTILFVSRPTEAIVAIAILSTVVAIWFTYWVSKYILK